jgi:hypothetical protein
MMSHLNTFLEEVIRKTLMFFLIFVSSLFCTQAYANDVAPFAGQCIEGKMYVEPGAVYVGPDGIFLRLEGNFVSVEALFVDEGGVYVNLRNHPDCGHGLYCDRCGGCNPNNRCQYRCKCPPRR